MLASNQQQIKTTADSIISKSAKSRVILVDELFASIKVEQMVAECNKTKMDLFSILRTTTGLAGYGFSHLSQAFTSEETKDLIGFSRSTLYNALQHLGIDWSGLSTRIGVAVANRVLQKGQWYFVVDDTLIVRDCSKHVELLAKVHDHNKDAYHKGFTMLSLGITDGISFVPLSFALLSSQQESCRYQDEAKKVKRSTKAGKKRTQACKAKMDVLLTLLRDAMNAGVSADAILMDSWFSAPKQVKQITNLGLHVVTMLKICRTRYKTTDGSTIRTDEVAQEIRQSKTKADIAKSISVDLGDGKLGKIIFIRNWCDEAALNRPYIPLLSTQASWSDEETVAIYPNRWAVEVFFRRLKGDFGLQSGNQTRNFESNQAMISIAHIRYNFTLLAQAELFPDKTLSEVLQLMRLDAIYSDTIEDHLNTLKAAVEVKDDLVTDISNTVLSAPNEVDRQELSAMICNRIESHLDNFIYDAIASIGQCRQPMLANRVHYGNITLSRQVFKEHKRRK